MICMKIKKGWFGIFFIVVSDRTKVKSKDLDYCFSRL